MMKDGKHIHIHIWTHTHNYALFVQKTAPWDTLSCTLQFAASPRQLYTA